MEHPIIDAIMGVVIVSLLLILIGVLFGAGTGKTGVFYDAIESFKSWFGGSRLSE